MNDFKYDYPIINNISDLLPAIEGRDEFTIVNKGDYTVVNYNVNFSDTFENINDFGISSKEKLFRKLRRECRGIIFDSHGSIINRPLEKFFNLSEKPEYSIENIDIFEDGVTILEKLDGSMITSYKLNNEIHFGTKMGHNTDIALYVKDFVKDKDNYIDFSTACADRKLTPIFEFCSRKNKVVIDYPEDKLVLLAIRNTITGEYIKYNDMVDIAHGNNIPIVASKNISSVNNIHDFVKNIRCLEGAEGVVIRYENGHMIKVKAEQYVLLHKTKEQITLEKNVLATILNDGIDDLIPLIVEEDLKNRLISYASNVTKNIHANARYIEDVVNLYSHLSQKDFAIKILEGDKELSSIIFKVRAGKNAYNELKNYILTNTSSTSKVEKIRHIIKENWKTLYLDE